MRDPLYANCTEECERPATCTVCRRRKSPLGRSVPAEIPTVRKPDGVR